MGGSRYVKGSGKLSRRDFMRLGGAAVGGGLLATYASAVPKLASVVGAPARRSLRVALPAEPGFLNPVMVTGDRNFSKISWQVFDSLLVYDYEKKQMVPQLATTWHQKSPTKWEFKLREGVQFQKGYGEMTADDVEFMVNHVVEGNKPLKFLYFFVKGAKATGKYTVEYELSQHFTPFLVTTARDRAAMIVSKKAYQEMGEEAFNRNPVGTGAFEVVNWRAGSEVTLRRHPKYWQAPMPNLDELTFRFIGDTVTRESLLRTGEIDFMDAPDYKNVARWRGDPNYVVTSVPAWGVDWLPFGVTTPPFNVKELRQAVSFALDREALARNLYYGEAEPTQGPLPKGYIGYPNPSVYPLRGDRAKAKELMQKAGVPNGFKTTALTTAQFKTLAEIIAGQLAEVGIQVSIEIVDPGTMNARTRARRFELLAVNLAFMTPDSDSTMYWFLHTNTVGNYGYANPQVDAWLEEARTVADRQKRGDIYQTVLKTALDDAPYAYLLHPNIVRIYRKGLEGVQRYPQDHVMTFRDTRWA